MYSQDIKKNRISNFIWSSIVDYIPFIPDKYRRRWDPRTILLCSGETSYFVDRIREELKLQCENIKKTFHHNFYIKKNNILIKHNKMVYENLKEEINLYEMPLILRKLIIYDLTGYFINVYQLTLNYHSSRFSKITNEENFEYEINFIKDSYGDLEEIIDSIEDDLEFLKESDEYIYYMKINRQEFMGSSSHKRLLLLLETFKWYRRFYLNIINMYEKEGYIKND